MKTCLTCQHCYKRECLKLGLALSAPYGICAHYKRRECVGDYEKRVCSNNYVLDVLKRKRKLDRLAEQLESTYDSLAAPPLNDKVTGTGNKAGVDDMAIKAIRTAHKFDMQEATFKMAMDEYTRVLSNVPKTSRDVFYKLMFTNARNFEIAKEFQITPRRVCQIRNEVLLAIYDFIPDEFRRF